MPNFDEKDIVAPTLKVGLLLAQLNEILGKE